MYPFKCNTVLSHLGYAKMPYISQQRDGCQLNWFQLQLCCLIPRPLPDFILEKNWEKAWDQNYVTDRQWWTRLVQTESTVSGP